MIDPKDLKKWFFLIAILYLVFPRDLIPDYIGRGFGLLDDFAVMGLLSYYFRGYVRRYTAGQAAQGGEGQGEANSGGAEAGDGERQQSESQRTGSPKRDAFRPSSDPHTVLGVSRGASQDEIRAAYRERMSKYHPDKVAHLGEDLQQLAHRKSVEIQKAYKQLHR